MNKQKYQQTRYVFHVKGVPTRTQLQPLPFSQEHEKYRLQRSSQRQDHKTIG